MRVLGFFQQPQDLEILLPVLSALRSRGEVAAGVASSLAAKFPAVVSELERNKIPVLVRADRLLRWGLVSFGRFDAMLAACESSAAPHRVGFHLARRASRKGIRTYVFQHGLENIGLNYSDAEFPIKQIEFGSEKILLWGPLETLHPEVPRATRDKCVSVGCPKAPIPHTPSVKRTVAVFENLHWSRYDDKYRQSFARDLTATIESLPDWHFLVKPHPTSQRLMSLRPPDRANVTWVDSAEQLSPGRALALAHAVITTPSTIAVDAARAGIPVAVAHYGLNLDRFAPLRPLQNVQDWLAFLSNPSAEPNREFLSKNLLPDDGCRRIIDIVCGQAPG